MKSRIFQKEDVWAIYFENKLPFKEIYYGRSFKEIVIP